MLIMCYVNKVDPVTYDQVHSACFGQLVNYSLRAKFQSWRTWVRGKQNFTSMKGELKFTANCWPVRTSPTNVRRSSAKKWRTRAKLWRTWADSPVFAANESSPVKCRINARSVNSSRLSVGQPRRVCVVIILCQYSIKLHIVMSNRNGAGRRWL